jgi:DNA polymerase-3 subunit chi
VRVAYIFDGRDQAAVSHAREAWQDAKARGDAVKYWQQDAEGRWQLQA